VILIYAFRALQLRISRLSFRTLLYVAPRGLITILLFLSIDPQKRIFLVNRSLIIQVILLSTLIMMVALMVTPGVNEKEARKEKMIGEDHAAELALDEKRN
jgi:hypothetical protein